MEWLDIARKNAKRLESLEQSFNVVPLVIMKDGIDSQAAWRNEIVFVVIYENCLLGAHAGAVQCVEEDFRTRLVDANFCRDNDGTEQRFQALILLQMIDSVSFVIGDDSHSDIFL